MFRVILSFFKRTQRKLDTEWLWPSIAENATSEEQAERTIKHHLDHDTIWSDLSEEEKEKVIKELPKSRHWES